MRKDLLIENTLAPSEQEQLLDWLETSSLLEVKQRLAQPCPDGFGLNASITTLLRIAYSPRQA